LSIEEVYVDLNKNSQQYTPWFKQAFEIAQQNLEKL
jgi:hypothetical protein